jgi:hypothetical protein
MGEGRLCGGWFILGCISVKSCNNEIMNASATAIRSAAPIVGHIARQDLLHLYRGGRPDYKRIADFAKLSKADLGKLAGVAKSSVRYDANIPEPVAERLREIANIANLIAEFFAGDAEKVGLWFELPNPVLGNISPRQMIRIGRYKRLLNFVVDAREAESATAAR